jgi:UrcA family protein
MTRKLIAVASACALLGVAFTATPAFAQSLGEQGTMRVPTGDLNLTSDSGAQHVLNRIKVASSSFCEDDNRTKDLKRRMESRKCRDRMVYMAVDKLDAPLVTAKYQEAGFKPPVLLTASEPTYQPSQRAEAPSGAGPSSGSRH